MAESFNVVELHLKSTKKIEPNIRLAKIKSLFSVNFERNQLKYFLMLFMEYHKPGSTGYMGHIICL